MTESKFEAKLFLITKDSEIAPLLLTIEFDKITISARVDNRIHPLSLGFIQKIDHFLHNLAGNIPSPECENPEKISMFLRYFSVQREK